MTDKTGRWWAEWTDEAGNQYYQWETLELGKLVVVGNSAFVLPPGEDTVERWTPSDDLLEALHTGGDILGNWTLTSVGSEPPAKEVVATAVHALTQH